ncbi:MAG: excinuclease ABC subunit UvrA [Myxococcota bacterium]
MSNISVRGAREHNLKGIDLDLPRDALVVITGVSGSGKSSLAFDTIYAEGQRRYVESLSAYARQFLDQNAKPNVERIDGLSPAISIEQRTTSKNPRSTVGTLTEILDYLRVLYARTGRVWSESRGAYLESLTVQQIVDRILALPEKTKFFLRAPVVRGKKGALKKELNGLRKQGFVRAVVDGEAVELADVESLDGRKTHDVDVVVDRIALKAGLRQRVTDSVELALETGGRTVIIDVVGGETLTLEEGYPTDDDGTPMPELDPALFSFNSPRGACPSCDGLGVLMEFDVDRVVPDRELSISDGAIAAYSGGLKGYYVGQVRAVLAHFGASMDTPFDQLPDEVQDAVLNGTGDAEVAMRFEGSKSSWETQRAFEGVMPNLRRRYRETESERQREELAKYMSRKICPDCGGTRLRKEARRVHVGGKPLDAFLSLSVRDALQFIRDLKLNARDREVAEPLRKEIGDRLSFLEAVGLSYLSLARPSTSLSGGEAQRIRLATQVGSALQGVIYVLDEPSIGLHQRDNDRLLVTLTALRDRGNTVLVVEHDEDTIRTADHVVDLGPGAGRLGGEVVASGSVKDLMKAKNSLTGRYLKGALSVPVPETRRPGSGDYLTVLGATGNNLTGVDVEIPVGTLTCVTGVSGSGKSTLVNDTLYKGFARAVNGAREAPSPHRAIGGTEHIDKIIEIDQSPIGRTPRSNPATYTGIFDLVRELFAGLPESRARGYKSGRFSFNVKGGRCEACQGDGVKKIEMHFLPDVFVTCEVCGGKRYNRETLEIEYKGASIADVLAMTVDEALDFLGAVPKIRRKLETLRSVGLDYVHLGQAATTLSGGEAQRIKLTRELSKRATGRTLYILDEPSTGLHFHDVARLLEVLQELVTGGNTVVVIEHNLDIIKTADYVIDLGPEGGDGGGQIVAVGTPEEVARHPDSHTGRYLARVLHL